MKNTKPKTTAKKTIKPTDEVKRIKSEFNFVWSRLDQAEERLGFLHEGQQVLLYGVILATTIGIVDFVWLCLK